MKAKLLTFQKEYYKVKMIAGISFERQEQHASFTNSTKMSNKNSKMQYKKCGRA